MELLKKICPFSFCRDLQRRILLAQLLDRLRILLLDRTSPLPTILDMTEGEKIMLNENSKYQNYHFEPVDLKSLYYWKEQHVYRLNIVFTKKVHFFKFKFSFWTHYFIFVIFMVWKQVPSQPTDREWQLSPEFPTVCQVVDAEKYIDRVIASVCCCFHELLPRFWVGYHKFSSIHLDLTIPFVNPFEIAMMFSSININYYLDLHNFSSIHFIS